MEGVKKGGKNERFIDSVPWIKTANSLPHTATDRILLALFRICIQKLCHQQTTEAIKEDKMSFWFLISFIFSLTMISGYLYFGFVLLYLGFVFSVLTTEKILQKIKSKTQQFIQTQKSNIHLAKIGIRNTKGGLYGNQ